MAPLLCVLYLLQLSAFFIEPTSTRRTTETLSTYAPETTTKTGNDISQAQGETWLHCIKNQKKMHFFNLSMVDVFILISYSNHLNQYTDSLLTGEQYIVKTYKAHFSSGFYPPDMFPLSPTHLLHCFLS